MFFATSPPIDLAPTWFGSAGADINSQGEIIGSVWADSNEIPRAALFNRDGPPILLDDLIQENSGWLHLMSAIDINDRSEIVGVGVYRGLPGIHAYLMAPVPEPVSLAVAITGAVVLFVRRR
jgi:hypothetical protein